MNRSRCRTNLGPIIAVLSLITAMVMSACGGGAAEKAAEGLTGNHNVDPEKLSPSEPGITLGNGDDTIATLSVPYQFTPPESATSVVVTDQPDFSSYQPQPWANTSGEWNFATDGTHSLYAVFFDADGEVVGSYVDTIVIDIFLGAELTLSFTTDLSRSRFAALEVNLPANAMTLQLSEDPDFADASWVDVASVPNQFEFATSGRHTLYLRVQDENGFVSQPTAADIVIEPFAPDAGGISAAGGADQTTSTTVDLSLTLPDTATEMKIYRSGEEAQVAWIPAATTATITTDTGGLNSFLQLMGPSRPASGR